ncbi:hypothetical protein PVAND_017861 [Polypedilum vanderplanki]|uniref:Glycine zipper domain-containing protein n=1 Tax=Polypedilum vanderplanki TaxID=319348 RepID=A0A9J6B9K8_POLVA|nr:hypothetical protein PVAND_017861 [Polypedilum vanderplanki]
MLVILNYALADLSFYTESNLRNTLKENYYENSLKITDNGEITTVTFDRVDESVDAISCVLIGAGSGAASGALFGTAAGFGVGTAVGGFGGLIVGAIAGGSMCPEKKKMTINFDNKTGQKLE